MEQVFFYLLFSGLSLFGLCVLVSIGAQASSRSRMPKGNRFVNYWMRRWL